MIQLNIRNLLEIKGKSTYWLYNQLGLSYNNVKRMVNNQTKAIRFENIELLCLILDCTPNELFLIDYDNY
ncbi:MAG: helix-turn-helix transcriptional regulator [Christensenellaceae bacterium]|nr:helix-turn-helix transcriptional regulator [Christensenellaceae bacterium]